MDVVVRTPHGDADIDVVAVPTDTTLGDLLSAVTGQATPSTARVDGRTVSTTRPLSDLDLVIGSVIDTRPVITGTADSSAPTVVNLLQVAGRGAGSVTPLAPGRYRIGTARRLNAPELEWAAVESAAVDLVVSEDSTVTVIPAAGLHGDLGPYTSAIGRDQLVGDTVWTEGPLNIGGRVFQLETPTGPTPRRSLPAPADDGSVPFHRSPPDARGEQPLVVDATRLAASAQPGLWLRRGTDPAAFDVPFGLRSNGVIAATIDFKQHRGAALVGSERFTAGLARALLVELSALHGPADLDIVIASSADRLPMWSWTRWLPHVRSGGPNSLPELFSDHAALATWANAVAKPRADPADTPSHGSDPDATAPNWQPPATSSAKRRVTLLVVDDLALWSQRESPLRVVLTDPPPELRVLALCVGMHEAPGMCTTLIEEVPPAVHLGAPVGDGSGSTRRPALFGSLATQHIRLSDAPHVVSDIRPALVETRIATEFARSLARLDDIDAHRSLAPPTRLAAPILSELVTAALKSRSDDDTVRRLRVPIGVASVTPRTAPAKRVTVEIELAGADPTVVAVADAEQHDLTVASLVLSAAAQHTPDELALLIVGHERPSWHADLPHIAGWVSHQDADDPTRLLHRVAHVLGEKPDLDVLVVIENAFESPRRDIATLVVGMTELAASLPNVHVLLTTRRGESVPPATRGRSGTFAWIGPDGNGVLERGHSSTAFIGVAPRQTPGADTSALTAFDAPSLVIRPSAHGRALSPLERRLSRSSADDRTVANDDELATAAIARQITTTTTEEPPPPDRLSLLPPPLPESVEFATLLDRHPGDGIPLGLVDRPERAENEIYWWQPGSGGSILALGSPRSGMTAVLDLLITGIAARISADDVHVYAIDALPQRRRAIDALPHTGGVVNPDDTEATIALVEGISAELKERIAARRHDDAPDLLLVVGDLGRLRRTLPAGVVDTVFERLTEIAATGAAVGINIVAIASRVADIGDMIRLTGDRLVGAVADADDRQRMGAPAIGPADRHVGRCWSTATSRRVQLATPPDSVEHEVARLGPEDARHRPPRPLPDGASA